MKLILWNSKVFNIEVGLPPTPAALSVQNVICNDYTLSIPPVNGANSYTWTFNQGSPYSFSGGTVQNIQAPFNGTVSVEASNSCGSSAPRTQYVSLYYDPNCNIALSTKKNETLSTTVMSELETQNSNNNTEKVSSDSIRSKKQYLVQPANVGFNTAVYPIPFSDNLNIEIKDKLDEGHRIDIVNILGQVVKTTDFEQDKIVLNCSDIISGVYIVKVIGLKSKRIETFNVSKI